MSLLRQEESEPEARGKPPNALLQQLRGVCSSCLGMLFLQLPIFGVKPHLFDRRTVQHSPSDPALRMASASLQHRLPASAQHLRVLAAIALPRRYHADAAVSVVLVVVVYKALHPLLSFLSIVEAVTGVQVIAAVLERPACSLAILSQYEIVDLPIEYCSTASEILSSLLSRHATTLSLNSCEYRMFCHSMKS